MNPGDGREESVRDNLQDTNCNSNSERNHISSLSSAVLCSLSAVNDHIDFFDGMQQHRRKTHATLASQLLLLTAVIVDAETKPAAPEVRREARRVEPGRTTEVVLTVAKDGRASATGGSIATGVEH